MSDDKPPREQLAAAAKHDPNTCTEGCRLEHHGDQAYSAEEVRIAHLEAEVVRLKVERDSQAAMAAAAKRERDRAREVAREVGNDRDQMWANAEDRGRLVEKYRTENEKLRAALEAKDEADDGAAALRELGPMAIKLAQTEEALQLQDAGHEVVQAVGIRSGESEARSKLLEWEWSDELDAWTWRPLIDWSEQQVIDFHAKHALAPNPLYLKGASRVGCWPCIFARKSEIRLVVELSPERIAQIRELEAEATAALQVRIAESGEARRYDRLTYFHTKDADGHHATPIDEMVEWSKTSRGGQQFLLLDDQPEGCVRWGLCETAPKEEEP